MTIKLDLEKLVAEDFMSIAGCARQTDWVGLRDWLFQMAYQQDAGALGVVASPEPNP